MKTMDPSIRLAAERVTAWHLARLRAHLQPQEPDVPSGVSADAAGNSADQPAPMNPQAMRDPAAPSTRPSYS